MIAWQLAALAIPSAASLALGSWVTHRLLCYRRSSDSQETLSEVSSEDSVLDRYRPMTRLLGSEDLDYLASRPGYRPEMGTRLRRSRRKIFRMYLAELSADFQNLHTRARRVAAEAPEEHADLAALLVTQQVAFWKAVAMIEIRLALSWAGVAPADTTGLVALVARLQQTVAATSPA